MTSLQRAVRRYMKVNNLSIEEMASLTNMKNDTLRVFLASKVNNHQKLTRIRFRSILNKGSQSSTPITVSTKPITVRMSVPVTTLSEALTRAAEFGHVVIEDNGVLFDVKKL